MSKQWYGVRCATRQEAKVIERLKEAKIEAYMPAIKRWRRRAGVREKADVAMFPGYVFVCCDIADLFRIRSIEGVHQFVRRVNELGDYEPFVFPDEVIGNVLLAQDRGEFDETKTYHEYRPKKGDQARVIAGRYRGWIVWVLGSTPKQRKAKVRLEGGREDYVFDLDFAHMDAA